MATFTATIAAVLLVSLLGSAIAGPCMFVDGDCKPSPSALPPGSKAAAINWVSLLKGFEACKGKSGAACSGTCAVVAGKGCTLTPAARKAYLGPLAPAFAACPALEAGVCGGNPNCKLGAGNKCVISAQGISATFDLPKNYPAAIPLLTGCKKLVAQPAACV